MKYQENIEAVAGLQPDYMGFIFYDKSPRFFDGKIPDVSKNIKKTGVFVNETIEGIIDKVKKNDLQAVQLHGNESAEFCKQLKRHYEEQRDEVILPNSTHNDRIEIIKVFSIKDDFDFSVLEPYENVCDYYLFDTKGKLPGGNGFTFNWEVLKNYPSKKPYFLSGGIGLEEIDNVLSFLRRQESKNCYAIDINSKFELKPGLKDIEKLKEFLNNVITRSPNVDRDDEVIS